MRKKNYTGTNNARTCHTGSPTWSRTSCCDFQPIPLPGLACTATNRYSLRALTVTVVIIVFAETYRAVTMYWDCALGLLRVILLDPLDAPKNVHSIMITLSQKRENSRRERLSDLPKAHCLFSMWPASCCGGQQCGSRWGTRRHLKLQGRPSVSSQSLSFILG